MSKNAKLLMVLASLACILLGLVARNLIRMRHDTKIDATIANLQQVDAAVAATRLTARTNGTLWNFVRKVICITSTAPYDPTIDNLRQANAALATNGVAGDTRNMWRKP